VLPGAALLILVTAFALGVGVGVGAPPPPPLPPLPVSPPPPLPVPPLVVPPVVPPPVSSAHAATKTKIIQRAMISARIFFIFYLQFLMFFMIAAGIPEQEPSLSCTLGCVIQKSTAYEQNKQTLSCLHS
jgi:hypothetical protein